MRTATVASPERDARLGDLLDAAKVDRDRIGIDDLDGEAGREQHRELRHRDLIGARAAGSVTLGRIR